MRVSLTVKLVAAFLVVSLSAIALVALFGAIAAEAEFNRFISQEAQTEFVSFVKDYYAAKGSLEGIEDAFKSLARRSEGQPGEPVRPLFFGLAAPNGIVLIPAEGFGAGDTAPAAVLALGTPIQAEGQVIGIALPLRRPPPRSRAQEQYIQRAGLALGGAVVSAVVLSVVLGTLLARTITRPVRELTTAAQRMARGELRQEVAVKTRDELGDLAASFNQMSADLARADQARRQMTADIAHELGNPLTVIGGYLDAMQSGDLAPTPERLSAVYAEIRQLEHILDDLRTLSLADAGALTLNRQPVAPHALLRRVAERYAHQAGLKNITLTVDGAEDLPELQADEARLTQVLSNLVTNALRFTPPGGEVRLAAEPHDNTYRLTVSDTGPGISADELPRIFDRFYRGDAARQGAGGESGLGLAIAKALVTAHGGQIRVESQPGRGATFVIELPRQDPPPT